MGVEGNEGTAARLTSRREVERRYEDEVFLTKQRERVEPIGIIGVPIAVDVRLVTRQSKKLALVLVEVTL